MKKETYETDLREVRDALALADEDRKLIVEDARKMIVICELDKDQGEALLRSKSPR